MSVGNVILNTYNKLTRRKNMTVQHEHLFYSRMRKVFAGITDSLAEGSEFKYMRLESHMTPGVPDIAYSYAGHHGWIELKSTLHHKVMNLEHFTLAQRNFLVEHGRIGGRCSILIEVRDCPYIGDIRLVRSTVRTSIVLLIPWFRLDDLFEHRKRITFKRLAELSEFVCERDVDVMYGLSRCL